MSSELQVIQSGAAGAKLACNFLCESIKNMNLNSLLRSRLRPRLRARQRPRKTIAMGGDFS
jgi:hypothetical protein